MIIQLLKSISLRPTNSVRKIFRFNSYIYELFTELSPFVWHNILFTVCHCDSAAYYLFCFAVYIPVTFSRWSLNWRFHLGFICVRKFFFIFENFGNFLIMCQWLCHGVFVFCWLAVFKAYSFKCCSVAGGNKRSNLHLYSILQNACNILLHIVLHSINEFKYIFWIVCFSLLSWVVCLLFLAACCLSLFFPCIFIPVCGHYKVVLFSLVAYFLVFVYRTDVHLERKNISWVLINVSRIIFH